MKLFQIVSEELELADSVPFRITLTVDIKE